MRAVLLFFTLSHLTLGIAAAFSAEANKSGEDPQSTGRTNLKSHQQHQEMQPQGPTGPLDTTSGGAPAASPQGETPAGMQAAPEGSSKTIVDTKGK